MSNSFEMMTKPRKQHAVLTLIDNEEGFDAKVTYQPSLKERTLKDNSPAVNAMVRICILLARPETRAQFAAPLEIQPGIPGIAGGSGSAKHTEIEEKKPLTFKEKCLKFFGKPTPLSDAL